MTFAERAKQYAAGVVGGGIPACKWVRLACKRHLDDLAASKGDGFPYLFDAGAVKDVCKFVELMPHTKGKWAANHEHIRLEEWQVFLIAVPFGWKRKSDGKRRYRRVYVEVPRKNAKSTITAALGNYMLAADGEHGAEVYSGAGSEKQAWEVFKPARLMAKNTPAFLSAYGVEVNAKTLSITGNASVFEPVIGKPGDGASPSFAITDEYHEHNTDEQYDTMLTGMGAREQPMSWVITTAGSDTSGPCYSLRSEACNVLSGTVENAALFALIYTIDDGDDWTDPAVLRKANPNYGVSVFEDYLLAQQRDAINEPRKQATFQTKHLNKWVTAASPYFNLEKWNRLADPALSLSEFAGRECWKGLDLASKLDLTADVSVFDRVEEDGQRHFYVFCRAYLPEARTEAPELRHYAEWALRGHLTTTPGDITDYAYIEGDITDDAEKFSLVEVGVDPHNATYLITRLQDVLGEDVVIEVPMTVMNLSEPMKEVQAMIEASRIHHDGNPVLAWAIGNVTAQEDRNANVFPRKEKADKKIDPAVALILAMGRAMVGSPALSIYEERGVRVI